MRRGYRGAAEVIRSVACGVQGRRGTDKVTGSVACGAQGWRSIDRVTGSVACGARKAGADQETSEIEPCLPEYGGS